METGIRSGRMGHLARVKTFTIGRVIDCAYHFIPSADYKFLFSFSRDFHLLVISLKETKLKDNESSGLLLQR